MSLIRFKNVEKRFDDALVLRDVFFRLEHGDRVGLIGKNGTGKTTLLNLILGREESTGGEVEVDRDLRIGFSAQRAREPGLPLALAPGPLQIGDAGPAVFDPGHDEEQIREPVQITKRRFSDRRLAMQRHGAALGAAAHGARHVERGGRRAAPGQDEAAQRLEFLFERVDGALARVRDLKHEALDRNRHGHARPRCRDVGGPLHCQASRRGHR